MYNVTFHSHYLFHYGKWHYGECGNVECRLCIMSLFIIILSIMSLWRVLFAERRLCSVAFLLSVCSSLCRMSLRRMSLHRRRFRLHFFFSSNTIWCQSYKNFFLLSLTMRSNKLEGLSLETLSSQILEFECKARANTIGAPFRCFSWVSSWCYQQMLDETGK